MSDIRQQQQGYEAFAVKDGDVILLNTVRETVWACHCLMDDDGNMLMEKPGCEIVKVVVREVVGDG